MRMKKKGIRDGDHDATIVDVTYSSDKNGEDFARVFFDTDSGEEFNDVIFSTFNNKNVFAAKAYDFLEGEGDESDIDLDDLFNQKCTITVKEKGDFQNIVAIEFHQDRNE